MSEHSSRAVLEEREGEGGGGWEGKEGLGGGEKREKRETIDLCILSSL